MNRKDEVDEIIKGVELSWRYIWCDSLICGCLGCINKSGRVESMGVSRFEWNQWVKDNPQTN